MVEVFKFGGASVKDAEGIQNLAKIVTSKKRASRLVIVVSAMGKSTNVVQSFVKKILCGENSKSEVDSFLEFHESAIKKLFSERPAGWDALVASFLEDLNASTENALRYMDTMLSYGELFSTFIVAAYLKVPFVDIRNYVKTNGVYGEADLYWEVTNQAIADAESEFQRYEIVVTQGFIGRDEEGYTTTLGREGSDFSAAILAHCLGAEAVTVWKDVAGLFNADPKHFEKAVLFDQLSYQEVIEMTYYGAKVIHPKTLYPLAASNIQLNVKSFLDPSLPGTRIFKTGEKTTTPCYVFKDNQVLISIRVKDRSFMDESKMANVLNALALFRVKANMLHHSALSISFCMDENEEKRKSIISHLKQKFSVLYNQHLSLATIKNYNAESESWLPENIEKIIEERTRLNYQVLYRTKQIGQELIEPD